MASRCKEASSGTYNVYALWVLMYYRQHQVLHTRETLSAHGILLNFML